MGISFGESRDGLSTFSVTLSLAYTGFVFFHCIPVILKAAVTKVLICATIQI